MWNGHRCNTIRMSCKMAEKAIQKQRISNYIIYGQFIIIIARYATRNILNCCYYYSVFSYTQFYYFVLYLCHLVRAGMRIANALEAIYLWKHFQHVVVASTQIVNVRYSSHTHIFNTRNFNYRFVIFRNPKPQLNNKIANHQFQPINNFRHFPIFPFIQFNWHYTIANCSKFEMIAFRVDFVCGWCCCSDLDSDSDSDSKRILNMCVVCG